jgi:pimeloyl-ACP methyl ester carboxylesterase
VRETLSAVQAPTLVLHRRHDVDSRIEEGRYLADHIPGAHFVELEGTDHFVAVDPDQSSTRSRSSCSDSSPRHPPCHP